MGSASALEVYLVDENNQPVTDANVSMFINSTDGSPAEYDLQPPPSGGPAGVYLSGGFLKGYATLVIEKANYKRIVQENIKLSADDCGNSITLTLKLTLEPL